MKKLLTLCMIAAMALSFGGCSKPAEEPAKDTTAETNESAEAKSNSLDYEQIVVGLDDTFAPMGFRDENGNLTGLDVDLMEAVSAEIGIPFQLQPIDWSMKETELNNKSIDLIWNGYTITPARQEAVLFSEPYLKNRQVVVTMADSDIKTLADLSGKQIGAQAESSAVDAIDTKPEIKDTFGNLVTLETNDLCLRDMEAGRIDAVVADEVILRYYISQKGEEKYRILDEDFGDEEYGIGARKEDEDLIKAVNNALDTLKENGKAGEISKKWFGSDIIGK